METNTGSSIYELMTDFLSVSVDFLWGMPLVILLIGGGCILFFIGGATPLLGFRHAIKLVTGSFHHSKDEEKKAEGQISHFQALNNALAATIGLGNISGVAIAISQGGPGAIFWMWIGGLVGMNTKFFECTLALMYRGKDYKGEVQGGPMYVIEKALPKQLKFLAIMFAVCGLIGTLCMFQVNQLTAYVAENVTVNSSFPVVQTLVGGICALMVFYNLRGGLKRLSYTTSRIVPFMCILYVFSCLFILGNNYDLIPGLIISIFKSAFSADAALGGAEGLAIAQILKIGIKRAAFSNEAGVGTAPMAHSNTKTLEPVSEGYVAMLGPFLDTVVVCTMTALVILISLNPSEVEGTTGILMTSLAFSKNFPSFGNLFLGISILLFSVSTMLGYANYNQKCWDYLFKGKRFFRDGSFQIWFCMSILLGAFISPTNVINILDIGFALMAIPNMIACLILAPKVRKALNLYRQKYQIGQNTNLSVNEIKS